MCFCVAVVSERACPPPLSRKVEEFEAEIHPKRPELGKRTIPFSGTAYIDREDFAEDPPKGFFRLAPGGQVRLKCPISTG